MAQHQLVIYVYTKTEVNNLIGNQSTKSYTKTETDNLLNLKTNLM